MYTATIRKDDNVGDEKQGEKLAYLISVGAEPITVNNITSRDSRQTLMAGWLKASLQK